MFISFLLKIDFIIRYVFYSYLSYMYWAYVWIWNIKSYICSMVEDSIIALIFLFYLLKGYVNLLMTMMQLPLPIVLHRNSGISYTNISFTTKWLFGVYLCLACITGLRFSPARVILEFFIRDDNYKCDWLQDRMSKW